MNELITAKKVQELLQVDRITIYRMLKDGRLHGFKVGNQWRFKQSEILRLIDHSPAIVKPEHTGIDLDAAELLPAHCIQAVQDVFAEMNGVAAVTTDLEGEPITSISNANPFCQLIHTSPSGRKACIASWQNLAKTTEVHENIRQCHAGMYYVCSPIQPGNSRAALLVAGQFHLNPIPQGEKNSIIEEISKKHNIDIAALRKAAQSIFTLSPEKHRKIGTWLKKLAKTFEIIAIERTDLLKRLKTISEMSTFQN